jgi:hypothetical protein
MPVYGVPANITLGHAEGLQQFSVLGMRVMCTNLGVRSPPSTAGVWSGS